MHSLRLAAVALGLSVVLVLSGCGSSDSSNNSPLQITTQSPLPPARANTAYSTTFTATGGRQPYAWSGSNLPAGLVISPAGVLSGTPSQSGSFTLSIAVSDAARDSASGNFDLTIAAPLQITTSSLINGSVGVAYQQTLIATGGFTPYTWSITQGNLPGDLTLNASTGVISGTPSNAGTSNFTVQVTDNGSPAVSVTASLSITITPPPARSAALYTLPGGPEGAPGLSVNDNGSLSLLPSSPELALKWGVTMSDSPTLPLVFAVAALSPNGSLGPPFMLESMLVNPDYSLTLYNIGNALPANCAGTPSVDPSGSNVYVTSCIDNAGTPGILIYPADGSLELLGNVAISGGPQTRLLRMTFSRDGTMAFVAVCPPTGSSSILSYSRTSDGMLTLTSTYNLAQTCAVQGIMASPVSNYLAMWQVDGTVQILSIGDNGALTPATDPFTIMQDPNRSGATLFDLTWDTSGSYLVAALNLTGTMPGGGVAVLSFSGSSLTQNDLPAGRGSERVVRDGSFFYAQRCGGSDCGDLQGFDLQNGQLLPLPGGPYPGGLAQDMVVY